MLKASSENGFTLIELIMVIALLAIVSTLGVSRYGDMKAKAARRVSIANQQSIGRAVEAYLAMGGKLNRLDSLTDAGSPSGRKGFHFDEHGSQGSVGGVYRGPDAVGGLSRAVVAEKNDGVSPGLAGALCAYVLDAGEAAALRELGLDYVMAHDTFAEGAPYAHYGKGDDGSVPQAIDGLDPGLSACVATAVTNGLVCAAIDGCVDFGRVIYQDCGQDLLPTKNWGQGYDEEAVKGEIRATGGALLAFGLGSSSSMIGASNGGLDAAPFSEALDRKFYRRFILLIRLKTSGSGAATLTTAEFAGVLDPEGNTIRKARHLLK